MGMKAERIVKHPKFEPSKNVFRDDFEKVEVKAQQDEHGWLVVWNIWIIFFI